MPNERLASLPIPNSWGTGLLPSSMLEVHPAHCPNVLTTLQLLTAGPAKIELEQLVYTALRLRPHCTPIQHSKSK